MAANKSFAQHPEISELQAPTEALHHQCWVQQAQTQAIPHNALQWLRMHRLVPLTCQFTKQATMNVDPCHWRWATKHRRKLSRWVIVVYTLKTTRFQISIISCHNLPELQNAPLNSYVKLRLLPDNQHRAKTRVIRNSRNPFFDEQFTMYGITSDQLKTCSLHLAVLASDQFSRDTVLGETFVKLSEAEKCRDINDNEGCKENSVELKLYPRPAYTDINSQVFLSIAHNQQTNSINCAVLKVKDLPTDEQLGQIG